ncbi:MAG: HlyD family efflux transporter periplasmic adaptor subunit [Planctomycetes bacterium]|nr:HlyD family efflux transporter periplasmic adaptor subunit [Planctomycetota bacterium]
MNSRVRCWVPSKLLVGLGLLLTLVACGDDAVVSAAGTAKVTRGTLQITVQEGGELQSANPSIVRSEIEGRATILELLPEGTAVKKGDRIGRLDSAGIEDKLNRQEIQLEQARSALLKAEQDVEIQKKKNAEFETAARTGVELAANAVKGYTEGKRPLELAKLQSDLTVAVEKQKRADKQAAASKRLKEKSFISQTELEADELAQKQSKEAVDIATRSLEQFQTWEAPDQLKRLGVDLEVKSIALERVRQQATSEMQQVEDALGARRKAHAYEKDARDKLEAQRGKAAILAPSDGIVVYGRQERGRNGGSEPMGIGKEVHEQEEIVRIPDLGSMIVEVDVHESAVKKIERGQRATVTVDAISGKVFSATVGRVALVASSQSSWLNPDLKVYETILNVDGDVEGMKPGMHAQVIVGVSVIVDALQIPLQAVREIGGKAWVYVKGNDGAAALREVVVGEHNESSVEVKEGLKEGENVYLAKPVGAPEPPAHDPNASPEVLPTGIAPTPAAGSGAAGDSGSGMGAAGSGNSPGAPMDDGNMPSGSGSRTGKMTDEQRKAMAERMKNMTPEEREKMRKGMGARGGEKKD